MKKIADAFIRATLIICLCSGAALAADPRTRITFLTEDDRDTKDLEAEILFGRDLAARILGNYKVVTDDNLIRYVNLIGKALTLFSGRSELRFYFVVLDSDEINAFATPGGYIFITSGAMKAMDNEAQLACVLAHEIAHVIEKHVVRRLDIRGDDSSSFSALSGAISANTAAVLNVLDKAMTDASEILFEKGYKLKEEMEADSTGMIIASLAGYDPAELAVYLRTSQGFEKKDASYEGEHPQIDVRISSIEKTLVENGLDSKKQAKVRSRFHAYLDK